MNEVGNLKISGRVWLRYLGFLLGLSLLFLNFVGERGSETLSPQHLGQEIIQRSQTEREPLPFGIFSKFESSQLGHPTHNVDTSQIVAEPKKIQEPNTFDSFIDSSGKEFFVVPYENKLTVDWSTELVAAGIKPFLSSQGNVVGIQINPEEGSILLQMGLLRGDLITSLNSYPLNDLQSLPGIVSTLKLDRGFELEVVRDGEVHRLGIIQEAKVKSETDELLPDPAVQSVQRRNQLLYTSARAFHMEELARLEAPSTLITPESPRNVQDILTSVIPRPDQPE